jgi:hypothetical protein
MRNIGLVAFGITAGILVPAIALTLDAGPKQREMLFAPGADSLELDGTKIYATLDHKLVDPGGIANLSLRTEGRVAVGIVVLGTSGSEGDRVPSPPVAVVHQTVTIEAHTTKTVPLKLGGAREDYSGFASYSIYVMSPQAANRLALLQRRSGPPIPSSDPDNEIPSESPATQTLFSAINGIGQPYLEGREAEMFGRGKVALFHAFNRPVNPSVKLDAPDTAVVGATVPVTVTVTNPSKQDEVSLKVSLLFPRLDDAYLGVSDKAVTGDSSDLTLAAGETKQIALHVTAAQAGVIGVQVDVQCQGSDDCYRVFRSGAFEAIEITSERPTQTASTR